MSKKMLFAFLVIMSLMVLTACGGYSKDDGSTASAEGEADTAVNDSATSAETGNATGNATYKLRLGHQSPEATNIHEYAVLFKNLLEEKTDGEVQVDIFPFRQLGTDRELLEAMQFGTLDFGVINGPPISGLHPKQL